MSIAETLALIKATSKISGEFVKEAVYDYISENPISANRPLTVKIGSDVYVYDGSKEVEIDIEDGDEVAY